MNETLVGIKAAMAAFFTALGAFLGWKGVMAIVWVVAMLLDYISGTAAACKSGQWCSATARQGLWHKGGMIIVVTVAAIADGVAYDHPAAGTGVVHYYRAGQHFGERCETGSCGAQLADQAAEGQFEGRRQYRRRNRRGR